MTPLNTPSLPQQDFDDFNTKELRRLTSQLTLAQQQQAAAQAVSDSLTTRLTAFQKTLALAQANATTAAANLAEGQSITQTVDKALPLAKSARDQAVIITGKVEPVYAKAYETALLVIEAQEKIDALTEQVQRRTGKNEATSPKIVTGVATLNNDSATALAAVTTALQKTMIAYAAAREARAAAARVIQSNQRLRNLWAPGKPFNPAIPEGEGLWPAGQEPTDSIVKLANAIKQKDLTILAVLDSASKIALYQQQEQQSGTTQTALQLNTANDKLNRANAKAQAAQAALVAAEAAVA